MVKLSNMFTFLVQVRTELEKVSWPDTKDTTTLTLVVIIISLVVGAYLGAADYLFTTLLGLLVK